MSYTDQFNESELLPPIKEIRMVPSVFDADVIVNLVYEAKDLPGDLFIGLEKTAYYDSIEEWACGVMPHETSEWKNYRFGGARYDGENAIVSLHYTEKTRYSDPYELKNKIIEVLNLEQR